MTTYDPALLDAIEALPSLRWQGQVWRHMFNDYAPERINTGGARWNPPGIGAIYTSMNRATAIAEGDHAIEMQPRRIYRRRMLYALTLDVPDIVDLTTEHALATAGLTLTDIERDDHRPCQRVGGAVAWLGRGGILVPSARDAGSNVVILIGSGGTAEIERVSEETLYEAP